MRYDDYDFDSRIVVTAKGKAVEIAVWLDKPVPEKWLARLASTSSSCPRSTG